VIDSLQTLNKQLEDQAATRESDLEGVEERLEEIEKLQVDWDTYRAASLPADEVDEIIKVETQARLKAIADIRKIAPDLDIDISLGVQGMLEQAIAQIAPDLNLEGQSETAIAGIWQGIMVAPKPEASPGIEPEPDRLPTGNSTGGRGKASTASIYLQETYAGRFS